MAVTRELRNAERILTVSRIVPDGPMRGRAENGVSEPVGVVGSAGRRRRSDRRRRSETGEAETAAGSRRRGHGVFRRFDGSADGGGGAGFAVAVDGGAASGAALVTVETVEVGLRDEDLAGEGAESFAFFVESCGFDFLLRAAR